MNLYIPEKFKTEEVREVSLTVQDLIDFELRVKVCLKNIYGN